MKQTRLKFTASFKAQVALEAIKNKKALPDLSKQFDVNPVQRLARFHPATTL